MIFIQKNGHEINPDFKIDKINELGVEIHFEDSGKHAEEIARRTNAVVVLVPRPWNQDYEPSNRDSILKPHVYKDQPEMVRAYFTLADYILG